MRLLLDTHVLLWALSGSKRLADEARELIESPDNDVLFSAASVWEIAIKRTLGRLEVPEDYLEAVEASDIQLLSITGEHAEAAGALPRHHDDPFDRMLIAQARIDELTLVTADRRLPDYGVPVLLARQ